LKALIARIALLMLSLPVMAADGEAIGGPDRQPAWLIELPQSVNTVLVADTGNATMHRFTRHGKALTWSDERYMSIGQNGVRKQRAWDKKTPLGAYFVTERLDTSRMHEKYGVAAFPLDYPNAWDRYSQRTGDGIWLHGVDRNRPKRPPLDTEGCLSVPNDALLQIAKNLTILVTPVIVARDMQWASPAELEEMRLQFRIAMDLWQQSVREGDLLTYLSLYSHDFRHRGMDKAEWSAFRLQVFESRRIGSFEIRDLLLLADPADPDLFLSRFTQVLQTGNATITTTKRLYWRRSEENRWRIVTEGAG